MFRLTQSRNLRSPIGHDMHNQIRILRIIGFQVHRKIMRAIHARVHHEYI